jgi:hypothetical protein
MSNHCLFDKKCLRLALKYELGHCRMCIRVAALVHLTSGTSLVVLVSVPAGKCLYCTGIPPPYSALHLALFLYSALA